MRLFVFARAHEIFHLHLFELAGAKDKVAGRDFVAKRFADLRHAERQLAPAGIQHVEEVYEDPLRSLRPQIDERIGVVFQRRAYVRAKHEIKGSRFGEVLRTTVWTGDLSFTK